MSVDLAKLALKETNWRELKRGGLRLVREPKWWDLYIVGDYAGLGFSKNFNFILDCNKYVM